MGRRDEDPRPPVELWGESSSQHAETQVVELGGDRARRRTPLLAAAAVVALLVAGLALGGPDDGGAGPPSEERDDSAAPELEPDPTTTTTRRRTTTTTSTTTTTLPVGPVFGEPVGASLLTTTGGASFWTLLDLDTGARASFRLDNSDGFNVVPVRGGVIVVRQRVAEYVALPPASPATIDDSGDLVVQPVPIGEADRVVQSGSPDSVWLVRDFAEDPSQPGVRAQLVDLGGTPLSDVVFAPVAYIPGGTDDGVLFEAGGRVFLAGDDGMRTIATGDLLDAAGTKLAIYTCDPHAVCATDVLDLVTGTSRRVPLVGNPWHVGASVFLAATGDVAVISYGPPGAIELFLTDATVVSAPGVFGVNDAVWLPGDLGLVATTGSGVRRIVEVDGGLVHEPITALEDVQADFVYVISR